MRTSDDLSRILRSIDGRGYGGYKQILGTYDLGRIELSVDHVQVDPYAPPSRMRIFIPSQVSQIPQDLLADREGRIAVGDFLTRAFESASHSERAVSIAHPGQEILERTSVIADHDGIEARLTVQLPAAGRRIRGREAENILLRRLPVLADHALTAQAIDLDALRESVTYLRDWNDLRRHMDATHVVAFVADGSVLPRAAGNSDKPLSADPVPFQSPESLRTSFALASGRVVTGMAIPAGITLIVGGGYHGKSTLLRALELGVYPHIIGDGREWVATDPSAAAIRAEDGRSVANVDISPFITNLPSGKDTHTFTTSNASGSTSQAANVMEALEAGTHTLLIDEDTSATNFMIRDAQMKALIPDSEEPITPLVDRVASLRDDHNVSTIVVAGGSGAFFSQADLVIAMNTYIPDDVTQRAHQIAAANISQNPPSARTEDAFSEALRHDRIVQPASLHPADKKKPAKAIGRTEIRFGREDIALSALNQLADNAQTAAIAEALECIAQEADGTKTARSLVDEILTWVADSGLDALTPRGKYMGNLALARRQEIMAALNRYRKLVVAPSFTS
ncbi:MAG: ABC-ATPase domain-containing protein [Actinomycetaceae bacterium]|nr:ABC-ATPase domain-containing protein [Actinomycetaceae bacterium]MDY6083395.1 ABC-ATPase domain-containing protein [Actinomycetaceae bacterium]